MLVLLKWEKVPKKFQNEGIVTYFKAGQSTEEDTRNQCSCQDMSLSL